MNRPKSQGEEFSCLPLNARAEREKNLCSFIVMILFAVR